MGKRDTRAMQTTITNRTVGARGPKRQAACEKGVRRPRSSPKPAPGAGQEAIAAGAAKTCRKSAPKPALVARGEALDRQTARQLERGRLAVEARLDLHGMRQRDAHAALRRFLKSAQGKGYRHVLVITGKGADPDARRSFYEAEERGVLRQAVPHWLGQPDLAHVVISYSEAPRRFGGEGALYVRLRAAKRS